MTSPGEAEAEVEVMGEYDRMACAIARTFWIPGLDPEEIVQEARIALLRAARNFRGIGSFEAYARVAIKNTLMNLRRAARHSKRFAELAPVQLEEWCLVETEDLDSVIDTRDRIRRISGLMGSLSPRQRVALRLVINGTSYEQAGEQMGTTEMAVKSLVVRARRLLAAA